ncbi:hypothetical protein VKT23_015742 [Stygiomarasmius scandens]|uniref:Heterokaryon incompatibility domain-containing protein n=1 Tax=Marasmiellus scandens TaxID=2682957 RepID=A0ABR1J0I7_9AGAR
MAATHICPRRLIDTCSIKLVELGNSNTVPPYAILSHRWIKKEEVVYKEFRGAGYETLQKSGYRKIKAACQQARKDGIRYIWVDTCCIDQGNHEDVAATIPSTYAYYQNAEVCYAYLADVEKKEDMFPGSSLKRGSEWFQRGWTLQELLAPRTVIFFDKSWHCIGDKHQLRDDIHRITDIPTAVLSSEQSIRDVDVLARMTWTMHRITTKEQDRAYCLQGLLGVSVEPDYNETSLTSFSRLGDTLFDVHPQLKQRLGIRDNLFRSHRWIQEEEEKKTSIMNPTSPILMASIDVCPRRFLDTDTLEIVEFSENTTISRYAILSHVWIEGEEIIHKEFTHLGDSSIKSKLGYQKIEAACKQARHDGIRYIWVDTCCIKQEDHADVSANITSMYGYYQNAEVCYVYLMDVQEKSEMFTHPDKSCRGTEWLRRGWTLQELLAPRTVIFFSKNWQCVGDKHQLRDDLHRITNIPIAVLCSEQSIRDIDVLTRMTWIMQRTTTKEQDRAYCLQGLLGLSVKPNYNETSLTSFSRLGQALFDARPDLRGGLKNGVHLFRSHRWIRGEGKKRISITNPMSPLLMASIDVCPRRFLDTGTLKIVEFSEYTTIPRYAILSHVWIKGEEVVYKELVHVEDLSSIQSKLGYQKIAAACQRARHDGIRYIWVDTCCIKQEDHADVSVNITSMYGYYQNAEVCYAYLMDAREKSEMFSHTNKSYRGTKWFRRGWTLQELLAPRTVIFLDKNWQRIGDKYELRNDISQQTDIPPTILSGEESIQNTDLLTRASWATDRQTTKEQDQLYCLQGILGVTIQPNYEESGSTCVSRLMEVLFKIQPRLMKELGDSPLSHRLVREKEKKKISIINPRSPALISPIDVYPHRLIDTHSLQLVEFKENDTIPPFAILSHRHMPKGEIDYEEFIHCQSKTRWKPGYHKVLAACMRARRDGIRHIWVDTCCIKQDDHKDVAANITSMYGYYQNAEVCYAYLADVEDIIWSWGGNERGSEWFNRGWTLQELLAPRTVVFFNKYWQYVGDKDNLRYDIHLRTGIPLNILSGKQSIQDIDVLERMSWARNRLVTKEQDRAYCLQGLLEVKVEPKSREESPFAPLNRLGIALFDMEKLKLEAGDFSRLFSDPDSSCFYNLLRDKFSPSWLGISP